MAYDFPASPTLNQQVTVGGQVYQWNGQGWILRNSGTSITMSDTPPANPVAGQLWWETDTGMLFIYFNDGNSSQWVQVNNTGVPPVATANVVGWRFIYVSATQCRLIPYNGDSIKIDGRLYPIPAAGVNVSTSGLSASTLYYAYAYIDGTGAIAIQMSAAAHSTDTRTGNVGVEVRTSDPTRSLIGMVRLNASTQYQDDPQYHGVRSWMNRRSRSVYSTTLGTSTAFPTSIAEISTALRIFFLSWTSEQIVWTTATTIYSSVATTVTMNFTLDGGGFGYSMAINQDASGRVLPVPLAFNGPVAEGFHTATLSGVNTPAGASLYSASWHSIMLTE